MPITRAQALAIEAQGASDDHDTSSDGSEKTNDFICVYPQPPSTPTCPEDTSPSKPRTTSPSIAPAKTPDPFSQTLDDLVTSLTQTRTTLHTQIINAMTLTPNELASITADMITLVEQQTRTAIARVTTYTDKVLQMMMRQAFTGNGPLSQEKLAFGVQCGVELTFGVDLLAEQSGEVETWEMGPRGLVEVEESDNKDGILNSGEEKENRVWSEVVKDEKVEMWPIGPNGLVKAEGDDEDRGAVREAEEMTSYRCRWTEGLRGEEVDARSAWSTSQHEEMPMKAVSASMSSLSVSSADEILDGRQGRARLNSGKKRKSEVVLDEPGAEDGAAPEHRRKTGRSFVK